VLSEGHRWISRNDLACHYPRFDLQLTNNGVGSVSNLRTPEAPRGCFRAASVRRDVVAPGVIEAAAVALANDSDFGLGRSVFT
jgi:hypothetical protein